MAIIIQMLLAIISTFTIKGTKLYIPVVTLSARDSHKLSNFLSKGFERLGFFSWMQNKRENKNTTNEYRYFLELKIVGANRLFALFYSKEEVNSKRFTFRKYYLPKDIFMIKQSFQI